MLDMSVADLESVATFYSLIFRKPVGKHVILICDSVSCWIMGCESVRDHLRRRLGIDLGQTTADRPIHPVDDPLPRSVRPSACDDGRLRSSTDR